ncbi:hypothetical protein DCAR_0624586 [Daucus carota subsp. sativus]|uniref:Uncharacterized protein n=1 Tax=Daucus carota subsp. sativus TaxID=79200 RepID=A0A164VXD0_DAUCS|nr:hypothetical protein DCAR_0624586 [Daucus carota subsp. sativus]
MRKTTMIIVSIILDFESNRIHGGNVVSKPAPRKSSKLPLAMSPADDQPSNKSSVQLEEPVMSPPADQPPSALHLDPHPPVDNKPVDTSNPPSL